MIPKLLEDLKAHWVKLSLEERDFVSNCESVFEWVGKLDPKSTQRLILIKEVCVEGKEK